MALESPHIYGNGTTTTTVGDNIYTNFYYKKALVEAAKEAYFGQLADTMAMPKNFGKTIKLFHYMPILDDRNWNDQGIDAQGYSAAANFATNTTVAKFVMKLTPPANSGEAIYFEGAQQDDTNSAGAFTAAKASAEMKAVQWCRQYLKADTQVFNHNTDLSVAGQTTPASGGTIANGTGSAALAGWKYEAYAAVTVGDGAYKFGNLYGSSKDVGTITAKIPALTETGGRVNRVGMTRITLEGTIEKFGLFSEYSQEALDFDNDEELESHIVGEAVKAANEITEDQLQIDLLNGAGVIRYTGDATSAATLTGGGVGDTPDVLTYADLVRLSIELDENRCPKNTKVITGSRMVDTKVVNAARYAYIGSELIPTLMKLEDYHGNPAFIPVAQYGAATTVARGEIGAVHDFRFIVVPEMMHWDGAGASPAGDDEVCICGPDTEGALKINVYPILVVGDGSFATIGFQTDGKTVKFNIKHVKPGMDSSYSRDDPYGEIGFWSIKWYYGTMILRPERLALIKTVALM